MAGKRDYGFSWELLGDLARGRPTLGPQMSVHAYRLMQFTLRDLIEQRLGKPETDRIFYGAGLLAGREFHRHLTGVAKSLPEYITILQTALRQLGMGLLEVEVADLERGRFTLTVSEDLDCSGLPRLEYAACVYDAGLIAGLLEAFYGEPYQARETDCWCMGAETCRFEASPAGEEG